MLIFPGRQFFWPCFKLRFIAASEQFSEFLFTIYPIKFVSFLEKFPCKPLNFVSI